MLPAQAGVVRPAAGAGVAPSRAPRAGGGGPAVESSSQSAVWCSPRRRGWSAQLAPIIDTLDVLPAQAGVVRRWSRFHRWRKRAPRAGGGGPDGFTDTDGARECSPRRRGWSVTVMSLHGGEPVLPAQAGVVRPSGGRPPSSLRAPRAGGGGPTTSSGSSRVNQCSPRRRGWSVPAARTEAAPAVLPAQAGVVRRSPGPAARGWSAPRAGGGGPSATSAASSIHTCSPRRRGCSEPAAEAARRG